MCIGTDAPLELVGFILGNVDARAVVPLLACVASHLHEHIGIAVHRYMWHMHVP